MSSKNEGIEKNDLRGKILTLLEPGITHLPQSTDYGIYCLLLLHVVEKKKKNKNRKKKNKNKNKKRRRNNKKKKT